MPKTLPKEIANDTANISYIKTQSNAQLYRLREQGNYGAAVELFLRQHRTTKYLTIDMLIDELNHYPI